MARFATPGTRETGCMPVWYSVGTICRGRFDKALKISEMGMVAKVGVEPTWTVRSAGF